MKLTRRTLIASLAAASVLPAALPSPAQADPVVTLPPAPPPPQFGYSMNGGEWWTTGFDSREEAIEDAMEYEPESAFLTAQVSRMPAYTPTWLAEDMTNAVFDGCTDPARQIVSCFVGSNEELDFDGEYVDAIEGAPRDELRLKARAAVAAALVRAGQPDWAALALVGEAISDQDIDHTDPRWQAMAGDTVLEAELSALLKAWTEEHDLDRSTNMLDTNQEQRHEVEPPPMNDREMA